MKKPNEQDLFIEVLADMICNYMQTQQERQQRAAFFVKIFKDAGIQLQIIS
ncbi:hypothetical protein [Paenibacillus timonensis]|uniref:hypothetical protein n=1 Tax=Paenibacillus timonensis TaxID=225915 RepID=UPI003F9E8637